MIKLVGLLLVLNALIVTGWWVATDQPGKGWVFTVCLAALFSGAFLLLQDRATEITVKGVGTIRAAAEKASIDAEAVAELRERVEAQSATVDLVAQQATQARNVSEQLSAKLGTAESRVEALDSALEKANEKVAELDQISAFTSTVIAAQNDDRYARDAQDVLALCREFDLAVPRAYEPFRKPREESRQ